MTKPFCPESCWAYGENVKGACNECINGENVAWAVTTWVVLLGEEIVEIDGEGKEGYHVKDGGWVSRDAVDFG